jgi:hypothetical protein
VSSHFLDPSQKQTWFGFPSASDHGFAPTKNLAAKIASFLFASFANSRKDREVTFRIGRIFRNLGLALALHD